MSSDQQADLAEFRTLPDAAGQDIKDASAWSPGNGQETRTNRCANCGSHVDPDTARVLGREGQPVDRCFGCAIARQMVAGAGAGRETDEIRTSRAGVANRGGGR